LRKGEIAKTKVSEKAAKTLKQIPAAKNAFSLSL
jgi:hypothetical protein